MRDVIYLLFQLLTTLAKLQQPGGARTVIAENSILKQQLIIHSRSRQRAPNLSTQDRALLGFWSLFLNPRRITKSAIIIKPSTLLRFHNTLKQRKYRQLYSTGGGRKPGPKRPSKEVINAIVEMKRRDPRFGCPRIAQQINLVFDLDLDKDTVAACFSYQRRLEVVIRQGQVRVTEPGVRYLYAQLPIYGSHSIMAARAAVAAHRQGLFREFHPALMTTDSGLDMNVIFATAEKAGLDVEKLQADMRDPLVHQYLEEVRALAEVLDITGTPSFIIGDAKLSGGVTAGDLISELDRQRAQIKLLSRQ